MHQLLEVPPPDEELTIQRRELRSIASPQSLHEKLWGENRHPCFGPKIETIKIASDPVELLANNPIIELSLIVLI